MEELPNFLIKRNKHIVSILEHGMGEKIPDFVIEKHKPVICILDYEMTKPNCDLSYINMRFKLIPQGLVEAIITSSIQLDRINVAYYFINYDIYNRMIYDCPLISLAIKYNAKKIFNTLIESSCDINYNLYDWCGFMPLLYACRKDDLEIVKVLIDKGAYVNFRNHLDDNKSILQYCYVEKVSDKIVSFLISNGATV